MNVVRIKSIAAGMHSWLVETRRDFHSHPEIGRQEFRTQARILAMLKEFGIACEPIADTGVVGILKGTAPGSDSAAGGGKVVGIRADIDCLPMQEKNDVPYRSTVDGMMHACGHDAHTTILLGTAKALSELKNSFRGTVKFFFQPDEEGDGGADRMVQAGCMDNPTVDSVIGLHVMTYIPTGTIEIRYGKLNASSASVRMKIIGRSSHGAYPEKGVDAIVASAHVITALQTLVSRNISPLNSAVLSFGTIAGGEVGNALAEEVALRGTLRTLDVATRELCDRRIEEIATKTAEAFGARAEVQIRSGYKPLINHDEVVKVIEATGGELLGKENVLYKEFPSLGVEDFSFFLDKAPGAFYHLGCGNKAKGIIAPNHNSCFDIDEDCLPIGVQLQVVNALKLLGCR